jgi:hypothetical protein
MTTVYGVTRYGAKAQILRQLKDIPEFPKEHAWNASIYLTDKTFFCLNEMFSATKDIQVSNFGHSYHCRRCCQHHQLCYWFSLLSASSLSSSLSWLSASISYDDDIVIIMVLIVKFSVGVVSFVVIVDILSIIPSFKMPDAIRYRQQSIPTEMLTYYT